MTINILTGFAIVRDMSQPGEPVTEVRSSVQVHIGVPDSQTTFSYTIDSAPPNELPVVNMTSNDTFASLNNISVQELEKGGDTVDVLIGQVTWSGGTTQIMIIRVFDGTEETELIFRIGGAALPPINTVADFEALDNSITTVGAIPGNSPLGPGKNIPYSSLPGTTQTDNPVNGGSGDDLLNGTGSNDLINPGENDGDDVIIGSAGNDYILFSDSQYGDYYTIVYDGLAGPITVDLDHEWAVATVNKGGAGTDQLVDLHRAANFGQNGGGDGVGFVGTAFNDVFNVNMDSDTWIGIRAGAGNDTFNITGGNIVRIDYRGAANGINVNLNTGVIQDGAGGTDQLNNSGGVRIEIRGSDNNDTILGSGADERFILRAGNDTLDAGGGWDELRYDRSGVGPVNVNLATGTATGTWNGNAFSHSISGIEQVRGSRNDSDVITGDGGNNWFRGRGGNDTLNGGGGDDTLVGEDGNDVLNGGTGHDVAEFWMNSSDATVNIAGGNATVTSSQGMDVLTNIETIRFWDQDFAVNTSGATNGPDTITGTAGDDDIDGLGGDDSITGLAGNDTLRGSDGNDTLRGGDGDDQLWGGNGNDLLNPGENNEGWDQVLPGAGNDTVDMSQIVMGGVGIGHWDLNAGIIATVNGANNTGSINKGANGNTTLLNVVNPMNHWGLGIDGGDHDDVFNVTLDSSKYQWVGLWGGAGNNTYNIIGGHDDGTVRLNYNGANNAINANLATGSITGGYGGIDTLTVGSGALPKIELRGTDLSDTILGSDRNERFILREGNDTLDAGGGWDLLRYDRNGVDAVTVNLSTNTATGTWNGNAFTHTISNIEEVRGSRNANDTLIGDNNDNRLDGRGGNDTLIGNGGNDSLDGGDGNDSIAAGAGNDTIKDGAGDDTLFGGDGDDLFQGGSGADRFFGGNGNDTLLFDLSSITPQSFQAEVNLNTGDAGGVGIAQNRDVLGSIENYQLIGDIDLFATGSAANNLLQSDLGDDQLSGLGGDDELISGDGNDTLFGGDGADTLNSGAGNDIVYSGNGLDRVLLGDGNDRFEDNAQTGNLARDTVFGGGGDDTLQGRGGDDQLSGDWGNDLIFGRDGNDALFGGDGADTMDGGVGNDTVFGGNGADRAILGDGDDIFNDNAQGGVLGRDTVFGGNGNDTLNGGNGDDQFDGGNGADSILGGAGNDLLTGGAGNDTIDGGAGNDTVWGGPGQDRVILGDGDDLFQDSPETGVAGSDTVFGGGGNDTMQGNGGNDVLDGGWGSDILNGRGGNDLLTGGDQADTLNGGAGNDTLWGGNGADSGYMGAGDDIFHDNGQTGVNGRDTVFGGDGNDTFQGGGGNDVFFGGTGADLLFGRAGSDWLTGGAGGDTFVFEPGGGADVITDFEKGIDTLRLDDALWGGGLTAAQVVSTYATDIGADILFDFGGPTVTLKGVADLTGLAGDLDLF